MTDEEHIEYLKAYPPRPPLTLGSKIARAATAIALVLAAVGFAIGCTALVRELNIASCVNANLGARQQPSTEDAAAHVQFARELTTWGQSLSGVLDARDKQVAAKRFKAFLAENDLFNRQTAAYQATLQADQGERADNPLGRC